MDKRTGEETVYRPALLPLPVLLLPYSTNPNTWRVGRREEGEETAPCDWELTCSVTQRVTVTP